MAEQGYFTATNIPIDGQPADASTVNTSLLGLINEFNKQVPLTKISADQAWQIWTPTFTGFSTAPIVTARYCKVGRICFFIITTQTDGTSNSTSFSFTLPLTAYNTYYTKIPVALAVDNGSPATGLTYVQIQDGTNIAAGVKDGAFSLTSWTASGSKAIDMSGFYETSS